MRLGITIFAMLLASQLFTSPARIHRILLGALLVLGLLLGSAAEAACAGEPQSGFTTSISVSLTDADHQDSPARGQDKGCVHGHCHQAANAAEPANAVHAKFGLRALVTATVPAELAGITRPISIPPPKR